MMDFIVNNINILGFLTGDCSVLGNELEEVLNDIFLWIQISVPCLVFVLCLVDMAKAVVAQDEKGMKEAQIHAIKRIIIGIVIFFVPIIINILLEIAGLATGTCVIGG